MAMRIGRMIVRNIRNNRHVSNEIHRISTRRNWIGFHKRMISTSYFLLQEGMIDKTNPLECDDYFGVKSMVNLKKMFDARVHLGHHEGTWDPLTRPYIHGLRSTQHIIDLDKTVECLQCALNVLSHIVYRRGIVLFMTTNPRYDYLIQKTARNSGEYFITRAWHKGLFTNAHTMLGTDRLPDLIIAFNNSRFERIREAITEAAMCNIPVIGIVDTDCDPRLITYPIPGNDDTVDSVKYFCNVFQETIRNAKERLLLDEQKQEDGLEVKEKVDIVV